MGFLRRLKEDEAGNALMLSAAAMIPLVGVIGGGLDISRIYLVESRLQQACDSAALAARRELGGGTMDGTVPADIKDTADNFFENNFRTGMYGANNQKFTLSPGSETEMNGTASAKVPMTLMSVFGVDQHDISVTCSADLNLPNIDVMLVLDMSGSMSGQRVKDLKAAVFDFYDEVMSTKPDGARVRIGVVPYSGAVNVGETLRTENPAFLADSFEYQSRKAKFKKVSNNDGVNVGDKIEETWTTELLPRNPVQLAFADSPQYHWNKNNNKKRDECLAYAGTYTSREWTYVITNPRWLPDYWTHWRNNQKAACQGDVYRYRIAEEADKKAETFTDVFDKYVYDEYTFDISSFKLGQSVTTQTGSKGANVTSSWNGCIEERQTNPQHVWNSIPADAYDLDINLVPDASNPATQWKPMWPQITYDRGGPAKLETSTDKSTRGFNCPGAAMKLTEFPLEGSARNTLFENYVKALNPGGGTMHDIGMIWGARFISPNGIFASDNATAPNGDPIARHIIFMTDGEMGANPVNTTSYGNYDMDGRGAGFAASGAWKEAQLATIHNSRLDALCNRIKNNNITIWTVSFHYPLNQHTEGCSTGTGRAFEPDDASSLSDAFKKIASSIAELRLTD
ncbi:MAG: TadE/TadG family protein, partial [Alteraurantiacibacter sp.]